jgi:hypothetical protein
MARESGFDYPMWKTFFFCIASRRSLGHTQWVRNALSWHVKKPEHEAATSLHLQARIMRKPMALVPAVTASMGGSPF